MYICMCVWFRVFADDLIAKFLPSRAKLLFLLIHSLVSVTHCTYGLFYFFSAFAYAIWLLWIHFYKYLFVFIVAC